MKDPPNVDLLELELSEDESHEKIIEVVMQIFGLFHLIHMYVNLCFYF